jgi:hypothetical protein
VHFLFLYDDIEQLSQYWSFFFTHTTADFFFSLFLSLLIEVYVYGCLHISFNFRLETEYLVDHITLWTMSN